MFGITALAVIALAIVAYMMGTSRARSIAGTAQHLHSLPSYHGLYSGLWTLIVGILSLIAATVLADVWLNQSMVNQLPQDIRALPGIQQDRIMEDAKAIANKQIVSSALNERADEVRQQLAKTYAANSQLFNWVVAAIAVILSVIGSVLH